MSKKITFAAADNEVEKDSTGLQQEATTGVMTRGMIRRNVEGSNGTEYMSEDEKETAWTRVSGVRTRSQRYGEGRINTIQESNYSIDRTQQVYDTSIISDPNEPKTINKALRLSEKEQWRESAIQELKNFYSRDSWETVPRQQAHDMGKNIIGSKWVFKKKIEADGSIRYKSRVVSKGYMQIPGIDYTERYSPVATDSSTRLLIAMTLWNEDKGWICETIDIEAAFLEGDIEEPTFMEWPPGMKELEQINEKTRRTDCICLRKTIYGNVDAALRFYKTYAHYLTHDMGMKQCVANACLFTLKDEEGRTKLISSCHVDDTLLCGTKEEIEKFKKSLKIDLTSRILD
jgi:hypothetical protein